MGKGKKGKAVPLRSTKAHLRDRRYSCYSFLTSALEGGEWSASRPGRAVKVGSYDFSHTHDSPKKNRLF
jgi:hypothetical protein